MELHGISLADDRFVGTNFFRTKLVGLDFTSCQLEGIAISDAMTEVYGAKLGLCQAAALADALASSLRSSQSQEARIVTARLYRSLG